LEVFCLDRRLPEREWGYLEVAPFSFKDSTAYPQYYPTPLKVVLIQVALITTPNYLGERKLVIIPHHSPALLIEKGRMGVVLLLPGGWKNWVMVVGSL